MSLYSRPTSGASCSPHRDHRVLLGRQLQAAPLTPQGVQYLPQFLLPVLSPQAVSQAVAVLTGLGGSGFAAAAYNVSGGEF